MSQKVPSFSSPSAKAFKRRSLQSPFILNDLAGESENSGNLYSEESQEEDEGEIDLELEHEETEDGGDVSSDNTNNIFINPRKNEDNLVIHKRNLDYGFMPPTPIYQNRRNNSVSSLNSGGKGRAESPNVTNKRYSLQSFGNITPTTSNFNFNSPSLNTSNNHHRSRSTASMNYTPANLNMPPPPPKSIVPQNTPPMDAPAILTNGIDTPYATSPAKSPVHQPFKFNSMVMNNSSDNLSIPTTTSKPITTPQILPKPSYRRGHRYKHSSVSMNMFQDNQRKTSLNKPHNLPKKYAIPTFKEITSMISSNQRLKLSFCFLQCFLVLLAYVAGFHFNNGCLSTLAHILFYDVISNLFSVVVQIMSNFEVWRLSSLTYPFGLGRIEVLVGFALSVSLLFVGLDLFSHIVEELLISSLVKHGDSESHLGQHGHSHGSHDADDPNHQLHPVIYEIFVLVLIGITMLTSQIVNQTSKNSNKTTSDDLNSNNNYNNHVRTSSQIIPNGKRLSSIALKEPLREGIISRVEIYFKSKFGFRPHLFHSSTTNLSLIYSIYSLYYPFAQGILKLQPVGNLLSSLGLFSSSNDLDSVHVHSTDNTIEQEALKKDVMEATETINHISTVITAILVSIVAWRLIWKLGNILLLTSPSVDISRNNVTDANMDRIKNNTDVEGLIKSNVAQLEVYKNSYSIDEVKVARVNTRVYVVIMRVHMPGASDDDEAKFRFYCMRIVRGIMYQYVKGHLNSNNRNNYPDQNETVEEENKRSLINLLNLSTSIEDVEGIDNSGDQFEITVDVNRL